MIPLAILSLPALVLSFATLASAEDRPPPLNVLFIAVDDLRPELSSYGTEHSRTPNIDRLASQGMRFTRHYVHVPTCGASRFALLTGRSPASSGVTGGNRVFYSGPSALSQKKTPGAQSLPELFRRSGYRTVGIGKISHTPDGRVYSYDGSGDGRHEIPHAWDELPTPYGPWRRGWGAFFAYAGGTHREDGRGHKNLMEFIAETDGDLPDGLMAKTATEKLGELAKRDEPFFLGLGFFKPHLPFVATRGDWEALAQVDVPPPPQPAKIDSPYWHRSGEFYKYETDIAKTYPLASADQIRARRAYLACVRYVDRQVGKVLDKLDALGLAGSTIVVLWGDHGWHLGDSAMWGKGAPFERALLSPLIIKVPGMPTAGKANEALVETIDVFPTLVDLAQPAFTKTEHPLDGKSLRPLLYEAETAVHSAALSYWNRAISVRTLTHRLIVTRQHDELSNVELYDMRQSADPVENIASEERELVGQMSRHLPAVRRF